MRMALKIKMTFPYLQQKNCSLHFLSNRFNETGFTVLKTGWFGRGEKTKFAIYESLTNLMLKLMHSGLHSVRLAVTL